MFLDDSSKGAQGFVCRSCTRERSGDIGFQHDDQTSGSITRRIFIGPGAAEIVFRQYLINIGPLRFLALAILFLHTLFAPGAWQSARR